VVDSQVAIQGVFETDSNCQQEHETGANGGDAPVACGQQTQRRAEQYITGRSLAGRRRLTGAELDQGDEMHLPGNQDGNSKTDDSHAYAERHVFRPISTSRNHILNRERTRPEAHSQEHISTSRIFQTVWTSPRRSFAAALRDTAAPEAYTLTDIILDDLGGPSDYTRIIHERRLSTLKYVITMDTAESYDALANHYHLIFENWEASMEHHAAVLNAVLELECGLAGEAPTFPQGASPDARLLILASDVEIRLSKRSCRSGTGQKRRVESVAASVGIA
jgi:hypothetical protein